MSSEQYQQTILAGMVNSEAGAHSIQLALEKLTAELFDSKESSLFKACLTYHEQTGGVLTEPILLDLLQAAGSDEEKQAEYLDLLRTVQKIEFEEAEFRYAIARLQEVREAEGLTEILTDTMRALTSTIEKDGRKYRGLKDAKLILDQGLMSLREKIVTDTPEGSARAETEEAWAHYIAVKETPHKFRGIETGLTIVDDTTDGLKAGELWIVAAFAGDGKSITLMNAAWNAIVKQGKNVFVASAEMPKNQWRARLYCRHTQNEALGIGGLRYKDIQRGILTPDMEQAYQYALHDFQTNPSYGNCHILQLPYQATLEYLRAKMNQVQARWNIDLLIVDYLTLLTPPRKRVQQREELDDLLVQAKQLALTFNNGAGVPLFTAHQTNRQSWELAQKSGRYTLNAFAGTSEAEKSADVAFWLLSDPESPDVLRSGFLKVRDGELIPEFELRKQFTHMLVTDGSMITSLDSSLMDIPDDFNLNDMDDDLI